MNLQRLVLLLLLSCCISCLSSADKRKEDIMLSSSLMSVSFISSILFICVVISIVMFCGQLCAKFQFRETTQTPPFDSNSSQLPQRFYNDPWEPSVFISVATGSIASGHDPVYVTPNFISTKDEQSDLNSYNDQRLNNILSDLCYNDVYDRSRVHYLEQVTTGWFGRVLLSDIAGQNEQGVVCSLNENCPLIDSIIFVKEVTRGLIHENVIHFYGISTEQFPFLKIVEYCELGNVKTYLSNNKLNKEKLLSLCDHLVLGLEALHDMNIVHGDLSARNCVLSKDLTLKIGDYGDARLLYKDDYYKTIAIRWLPSEGFSYDLDKFTIKRQRVVKSSNLWSIGVTIWEILSQCEHQPYDDLRDRQVIRDHNKRLNYKYISDFEGCQYIEEMIKECCKKEINKRITLFRLKEVFSLLLNSKAKIGTNEFSHSWISIFPYSMVDIVSKSEIVNIDQSSSDLYQTASIHSPETLDYRSMKSFSNALTLTYDMEL